MATTVDRRRWLAWVFGTAWAPSAAWGLDGAAVPLARPPALALAQPAPPGLDPAGHLVSEKLDGVRAWWSGQALWFRSGLPIRAPVWFTAALPAQPLDGELWLGRGRFEALSALLRRDAGPTDPLWREVSYQVFELPDAPGSFAERAERLRVLLSETPGAAGIAQAIEQRAVPDRPSLDRWLTDVVAQGGEGLVLHRADAPYRTGRSPALYKLKPLGDAEAVVVGHLPGRGRHAGRLGALQVRDEAGRVFALGSGLSDAQRDHPPPLGSVVTYRFRGLTRHGLPRFATFWRLRDEP